MIKRQKSCVSCGEIFWSATHNCPNNQPDDIPESFVPVDESEQDDNITEETLRQWIPDETEMSEPVYSTEHSSHIIHTGEQYGQISRVYVDPFNYNVYQPATVRHSRKEKTTMVKSVITPHNDENHKIVMYALRLGLSVKYRYITGHFKITVRGRKDAVLRTVGFAAGLEEARRP